MITTAPAVDWPRVLPKTVLAACVLALGTAYVAEYFFGLKPCDLCLWQRVPYFVAGILALVSLGMSDGRPKIAALGLCAVAFAVGGGIAVHHVGVEQHWWSSVASCAGELPISMSANDLFAALAAPPDPACDAPTWVMFGVSAATWNSLLSFALAAMTAFGLWKIAGRNA